jgi:hypothetical protein
MSGIGWPSIIDATITQLRAYCPLLAGSVAGAAEFREGLQGYNTTLPALAAFVVPLDQDSDGNENRYGTGLQQIVTKRYGVIVEFDATADRRGQDPTRSYDAVEAALFAAILNWAPVDCRTIGNKGYWFAGGSFLDLDRARLFYQWVFALDFQITDDDGWHAPAVDLEAIEVDIFKVPPQDMLVDTPPAIVVIPTAPPPAPEGYANVFWALLGFDPIPSGPVDLGPPSSAASAPPLGIAGANQITIPQGSNVTISIGGQFDAGGTDFSGTIELIATDQNNPEDFWTTGPVPCNAGTESDLEFQALSAVIGPNDGTLQLTATMIGTGTYLSLSDVILTAATYTPGAAAERPALAKEDA